MQQRKKMSVLGKLSLPITCVFILLLAYLANRMFFWGRFITSQTCSHNKKCPFDYAFHFGEGVTDIGNSVLLKPWGNSLPSAHWPYGITTPGKPTGRWADGLIDFDFAGNDFGFPGIVPYLSGNTSTNAVIFSVARSPVLGAKFFKARGIEIPPYATPLSTQITWFKEYLNKVGSTQAERYTKVSKALILLGDIEGNDIGYALTQGKSISTVKTYVPYIIQGQVNALRELIKLGAKTIIIPGNSLLGCYPYVLTALPSDDPKVYDKYGCLKSVNDLIAFKNKFLERAVRRLGAEFPDVRLMYAQFSEGVQLFLDEYVASGKVTLSSCCGYGGKYNYDKNWFCGSWGVAVCPNPKDHMFWDGIHFTQETYHRIEQYLITESLKNLHCKSTLFSFDKYPKLYINVTTTCGFNLRK